MDAESTVVPFWWLLLLFLLHSPVRTAALNEPSKHRGDLKKSENQGRPSARLVLDNLRMRRLL